MGENGVMASKQDDRQVTESMCLLLQCLPLLHAFCRAIIEMANKKRYRTIARMFQNNTE